MPEIEVDGVFLGCNPPDTFPTGFKTAAESLPMLTVGQIRSFLAGKNSAFARRSVFGPDWILNQGSHGSCNGWSCARALSKTRVLRGLEKILLSGTDAYSQMNGGYDEGSTLADGMKVIEANGIAPESLNPGTERIYSHQISAEAKAARARFKGFELYAVDTEEELATGLLLNYVAVVAIHVPRGGSWWSVDGNGILMSGNGRGNHSVGCDDIRVLPNGELNYDMFNSHGTNWNTQGRAWTTWDRHYRETVGYHRFFLLRSAMDDPQGVNPP